MASSPETNIMDEENSGSASGFGSDIFVMFSLTNLFIVAVLVFVFYKLYCKLIKSSIENPAIELPKIRKDMTVAELRQFDGTQHDGRVLVAVNGFIFDVTRGRRFYGPGGPYAAFGGRDASRGFATFSITPSNKEYDDLSDLNSMEMESVKEWEAQFREKYDLVGRLLKPGDEPRNYSDEEPDDTDHSTNTADEKKVN
ncbi:hypothetical protein ACJJTC_003411 [Scirpophaga incertulas]